MAGDRRAIEVAARDLTERAVAAARVLTRAGQAIDDHQLVRAAAPLAAAATLFACDVAVRSRLTGAADG